MKLNAYQKTAITTVFATIFLIFVGGVVRSTGAGMGCPDWPKCFGQWIPPTQSSELPADYKSLYSEKRVDKNRKVVAYLERLGFSETAAKIENDPTIKIEEDFNAVKTWTEYVNRLIGAIIGLLIFATFLLSLKYWKTKKVIPILSFATFFLVGFQGWLGSIVVSTKLLPGMISTHMILAMLIVMFLIYTTFKATEDQLVVKVNAPLKKNMELLLIALLGITLVQMVFGTQVREEIDIIKNAIDSVPPRSTWIEQLGDMFELHRSFSWLFVIFGAVLAWYLYQKPMPAKLMKIGWWNVALIFGQILIGIGIAYLNVPKVLQVLHLTGIALMIAFQYYMYLLVRNADAVEGGA